MIICIGCGTAINPATMNYGIMKLFRPVVGLEISGREYVGMVDVCGDCLKKINVIK